MTASASDLWTGPQRLQVGPPSHRRQLRSTLAWLDLLGMVAAFTGALLFEGSRTETVQLDEFLSVRLRVANFLLFLGLTGAWHLCFRSSGLYDTRHPLLVHKRLAEAIRGVAFGTILVAACGVLLGLSAITPTFLVAFWGSASLLVLGQREALRFLLNALGKNSNLERHVIVAGTSPRALSLAHEIERDSGTSTRVVGFVDDEWTGTETFRASGRRVVADLKNLSAHLRQNVVDEMVIALPMSVWLRHRARIFTACAEQGITVRFPLSLVTDLHAQRGGRKDDVLLTVYHATVDGWELLVKRALDIGLAAPLLLALAPLFALVALVIRLDSPGPIFFSQERVGLNKRRFRMHKFRTMVAGAERRLAEFEHLNEMDGPVFKLQHDPRMTRIGRILRRSSIDELPQLWNVLRGEMSLVGPRPLPLRDVEGFEEDRHRRRFSMPPGLTGLWQVSGRNELSFDAWMELDLQYVDSWSIGLDLRILARTVPAVLTGRGAA